MARRRRDDDEDEDDVAEAPAADPAKPKPRNDAYTGMLAITFLSLVASGVLFYLDFSSLGEQKVSPPVVTVPPLGASAAR